MDSPGASFTKEDNPQLAKRPLKTNGHLANLELTSLVKEATDVIRHASLALGEWYDFPSVCEVILKGMGKII